MGINHFARSRAIFAAVAAAIASGVSHYAALLQAGADTYRSRGKGNNRSKVGRSYHGGGKVYPFSSKRQDERASRQFSRMMPNGHVITPEAVLEKRHATKVLAKPTKAPRKPHAARVEA